MSGKSTRRSRDPEATRETILEAARTVISRAGPEGVSLSEVAHLAGVNRGTAYQHFETREKLIQATVEWVSQQMFEAVFGSETVSEERRVEEVDVADLTERLAIFGMKNPELCRVWLLQVLASPDPAGDPFWREYLGSLERFAKSPMAVPGIDAEALAVMNLAGAFLWPVWARAHKNRAADDGIEKRDEQVRLAHRYADEALRLSLFGSMRTHAYPKIAQRFEQEVTV